MKNATYLVAFRVEKDVDNELYLEEWLAIHEAVHVLGDIWLMKSPLQAGELAHEITREDAYAGRKFDGRLIVLGLAPGTDWAHERLPDHADALLRELSP